MLSHHEIMWRESWVNLMLKMRDMPYYHYKGAKEKKGKKGSEEQTAIPGTRDILKEKFAKYIES